MKQRKLIKSRKESFHEPYIFSALQSAKVMLVVTTSVEYANAVWVKNKWSRYARLMQKESSKNLIPCYSGGDPEELPVVLRSRQAQNMDKLGAIQDLVRGVEKITGKKAVVSKVSVKKYNGINPVELNKSDVITGSYYVL